MSSKTASGAFVIFIVGILLWNLAFIMPAVWTAQDNLALAEPFYFAFSFTCHQFDHRSLCFYPKMNMIFDCNQEIKVDYSTRSTIIESPIYGTGYKLAVCARDVAIYGAMLIGGIVWGFLNRKNLDNQRWPHPKWLILSIIPIALDGGTQILGLRESTNELRLLTGGIVGFAVAFYIIPPINQILNPIIDDVVRFIGEKK